MESRYIRREKQAIFHCLVPSATLNSMRTIPLDRAVRDIYLITSLEIYYLWGL
jgi:hypothetical protein